jgi:D-glycero-beta-D-manno-heptose 1-phosphate adenylyltransferase
MDKLTEDKIQTVENLSAIVDKLKKQDKRIVFTNGCFDLIHTGHTRYLRLAREAGDYLIVAVNSDRSVQSLKGLQRPIIPLVERMEILAGFYFVDFVTSFDELDPYKIIEQVRPNILIKGGDWELDKIIGKDIVENSGGSVFTIPEIKGQSTTGIVDRVLSLQSQK